MKNNNEEHVNEVYTDKAENLLNICKKLFLFSFFTYLLGFFLYRTFDFGLIFELISYFFVLQASNTISQNNINLCKRNCIFSMIPIGWLIIYDFIIILLNLPQVIMQIFTFYSSFDYYFYYLSPYLVDIVLITLLSLLYTTLRSLEKIDNTQKTTDYTETFYDNL